MGNNYRPGAHNVLDERTGYKVKSTDVAKEWNGLVVRRKSFEPRHPQDFVRGKTDNQNVADPRSEPADSFLTPNEAHNAISAEADITEASATATPDGGNTGDGSVNDLSADLTASGSYTLTINKVTVAAASVIDTGNNGEFQLNDPNGALIGFGELNKTFHGGGLTFKVEEDGSTAFAAGDFFTIAVT
jgi:hypothetical protein